MFLTLRTPASTAESRLLFLFLCAQSPSSPSSNFWNLLVARQRLLLRGGIEVKGSIISEGEVFSGV